MTYRVLPAFIRRAIVRVVLRDVAVDPAERELLVLRGGDRLHDQLRVAVRGLGVVSRLAHLPHVANVRVSGYLEVDAL